MSVLIPLDRIQTNRFETRKNRTKEHVAKIAAAIVSAGRVLQPPTARIVQPDGWPVTFATGDTPGVDVVGLRRAAGEPPTWTALDSPDLVATLARTGCYVELASGGGTRLAALQRLAEDEAAGGPGLGQAEPRWASMPVELAPFTDDEMEAAAWSENHDREDLDPVDRAAAIAARIARHGWTHDQAGAALGMARATVSNILRWFEAFVAGSEAGAAALEAVRDGRLSEAKARALAGAFVVATAHEDLVAELHRGEGLTDLLLDAIEARDADEVRAFATRWADAVEEVAEDRAEAERREREPALFDGVTDDEPARVFECAVDIPDYLLRELAMVVEANPDAIDDDGVALPRLPVAKTGRTLGLVASATAYRIVSRNDFRESRTGRLMDQALVAQDVVLILAEYGVEVLDEPALQPEPHNVPGPNAEPDVVADKAVPPAPVEPEAVPSARPADVPSASTRPSAGAGGDEAPVSADVAAPSPTGRAPVPLPEPVLDEPYLWEDKPRWPPQIAPADDGRKRAGLLLSKSEINEIQSAARLPILERYRVERVSEHDYKEAVIRGARRAVQVRANYPCAYALSVNQVEAFAAWCAGRFRASAYDYSLGSTGGGFGPTDGPLVGAAKHAIEESDAAACLFDGDDEARRQLVRDAHRTAAVFVYHLFYADALKARATEASPQSVVEAPARVATATLDPEVEKCAGHLVHTSGDDATSTLRWVEGTSDRARIERYLAALRFLIETPSPFGIGLGTTRLSIFERSRRKLEARLVALDAEADSSATDDGTADDAADGFDDGGAALARVVGTVGAEMGVAGEVSADTSAETEPAVPYPKGFPMIARLHQAGLWSLDALRDDIRAKGGPAAWVDWADRHANGLGSTRAKRVAEAAFAPEGYTPDRPDVGRALDYACPACVAARDELCRKPGGGHHAESHAHAARTYLARTILADAAHAGDGAATPAPGVAAS